VDYKFSGDGLVIDSLKAVETQRMEVAIRRQVGAQIYSNQTLVLKGIYHWLSPSFYSIFIV